ncbi:MAG TPA: ABC transporter permease [Tepidisphaeraceae bacterium]|nr:ABC transporter permease [Tepidisphaeraceae bacterium]
MRSLLWKEWHEQRWKLAFGSLILGAFAGVGLHARVIADENLLEMVCFLAVLLLSVMSSTGLVPAEREEGTMRMLLALPVRPSLVFSIKMLIGVLLCVVPLIFSALVSIAIAGGREISTASILALHARTLAATLSLYFWMLALTVRLPTEARASLIAIGVLIIWMMLTLGLLAGEDWHRPGILSRLMALDPFVFLAGFPHTGWVVSLALAACVQATIALALCLWAAWQFPKAKEARP